MSLFAGIPFMMIVLTRRQLRRGANEALRRRLVHVLTRSYRDDVAWYYESIDLLRKFLLAGVIFIIDPHGEVQLWAGQVLALMFLLIHLRLQPFHNPVCGVVQVIAAALEPRILLWHTANGVCSYRKSLSADCRALADSLHVHDFDALLLERYR